MNILSLSGVTSSVSPQEKLLYILKISNYEVDVHPLLKSLISLPSSIVLANIMPCPIISSQITRLRIFSPNTCGYKYNSASEIFMLYITEID